MTGGTFPTFEVGGEQTDNLNNCLRDNLNYLYDRPCFRVTHSVDQNPTGGGDDVVHFDTVDAYGYLHGVVPHPTLDYQFNITDGGVWRFNWCLFVQPTATTWFYVGLHQYLGALTQSREQTYCADTYAPVSGSTEFAVPAGSYVGLNITRPDTNSFVIKAGFHSPVFSGHWVREF